MSSKEEIIKTLRRIKVSLQSNYPIQSLALFGSYSRSEQTQSSDVDILVELNGPIGSKFIELAEELESELQNKVDLVSRKAIKPQYFKAIEDDLIYV